MDENETGAPTGVRVVLFDGTEIPLDVEFVGMVDDMADWVAYYDPSVSTVPFRGIRIEELPAKSMLRFRHRQAFKAHVDGQS